MQYRFLADTGLEVSRLCLGSMNFADKTNEPESRAIFHLAREAGVNFLDTANAYSDGKAERMLGRFLSGCRDEFVLASKVGMPVEEGPLGRGLTRRHIMLQVEKSLSRLNTDRLDLYYVHRFDPSTSMEETLRAMDDLVRQGKVLHIGCSNWSAWQTALSLGVSRQLGLASFCCMQPMYNLVKRQAEVEILPLAQAANLGVMPYNPLGAGLLTGRYLDNPRAAGRLNELSFYTKRYAAQTYRETADRFVAFAKDNGHDPAALAMAWVLGHPAVTSGIAGPRTLAHMQTYLAAVEIDMTQDLREAISALGPPPPMATDRDDDR